MKATLLVKLRFVYLLSAALIFATASLAKLTAKYSEKEQRTPDLFLPALTIRQMTTTAAIFEILITVFVLIHIKKSPHRAIVSIIWTTILFYLYRRGQLVGPNPAPCKCFGGPNGLLGPHSQQAADFLLSYLLCGGLITLLFSRIVGAKVQPAILSPGPRRIRQSLPAILVWGLAMLAASAQAAGAAEFGPSYCAQGELHWTPIDHPTPEQLDAPPGDIPAASFTINEDTNGLWKLVLIHANQGSLLHNMSSTEVISYDGSNIYSVFYPSGTVSVATGAMTVVPTQNRFAARASAGPFPLDYGPQVGFLWFAFLGGRQLEASKSRSAFPNIMTFEPRTDPVAWSCELEYSLSMSHLIPLIVSARFALNTNAANQITDTHAEMDEPESVRQFETLQYKIQQIRASLGPLRERGEYKLVETASIESLTFPKHFHALLPYSLPLGRTNGIIYVDGLVTNLFLQEPGSISLLPELKGTISVQDRRVRAKKFDRWLRDVIYNITDETWILNIKDPKIQGALAGRWRTRIMYSKRPQEYRTVGIVFIIVLIVPALYYAKIRLRQNRGADVNLSAPKQGA